MEKTPTLLRSYRNLSAVCLGWFLLVVSFGSLQGIVSSINHEGGLGFFSMACFYSGAILCPFAATFFRRWNSKPVICCLTLAQIPLVLSYAIPALYTVLPAAFIGGVAQSVAFSLTGAYLVWVSSNLSKAKGDDTSKYLSSSFGIYYMSVSFAPAIGGLCSTFILSMETNKHSLSNETVSLNHSSLYLNRTVLPCGPDFCPMENKNVSKLDIADIVRYCLLGFYSLCMVAATLVFTFGIDGDSTRPEKRQTYSMYGVLVSTIGVIKHREFLVVAPIVFYNGIQWAFAVGDIMKAFGGCVFGAERVANFIATYHFATCISSVSAGMIEPKTGRKLLFILGFCFHCGTCIMTMFWTKYPQVLAYVLCVLWGLGSGIYLSQSHALMGELFPTNVESAMAVYLMFRSLGQIVGFGYAHFLCMDTKIYITGAVCTVGTVVLSLFKTKSQPLKDLDQVEEEKLTFNDIIIPILMHVVDLILERD